jgi:hypothetical protein
MLEIYLLLAATLASSHQAPSRYKDVCPNGGPQYCANVGKRAVNNSTMPPVLRNIDVGVIRGVAWRPKGSVIGISEALPQAGIKREVRHAPRDAFYYIVDDEDGHVFVRECAEIDGR